MTATINPGTPAVAYVPTTVTATLTLHQALIIAVIDGALSPGEPLGFFELLGNHPLYDKYQQERERIMYRTSAVGKFDDLTHGL